MIKKIAFIPLLLRAGAFILSPARSALIWGATNPIKATVLAYLGTQTNIVSEAASDLTSLASSLVDSGDDVKYKTFSNQLMVDFERKFNSFNEKAHNDMFKDAFHGYALLVATGKEVDADRAVKELLKEYRIIFLNFKNEFVLSKRDGELDNKKIEIINKLDSILNGYPDVFDKNFMNIINGLKQEAKNESGKISQDAINDMESNLGIDESKPTIEEPVAKSVYTNPPSPFAQKTEEMEAWRREREKRRQNRISILEYYKNPSYESYDSYGDLKLAFYDFINNMPDKKQYDKFLTKEQKSNDYVFNEIKRYIPTSSLTSSREISRTILMNDIENAFCDYISRNYKYGNKFKKTCEGSQYSKPYVIPPNSLGNKLEEEFGENQLYVKRIY